ncbi:uncharacterized protein BCR38DRAFT_332638 [Pseudomassariella vexata]|uniref:Aminoglycoside phosphotransferase domain-containing protein n=1 Tax=Pseudomassariella vexata TaxID=1141098 RepID=A0A1Y2EG55_9PEZI|nr:uncharacterized protein BCR38DRAFT_332638 [Pseudomassariella vexata]ORY69775.1 hypothetical protein BCR38DRAFT_332638 [Pseudomassariella vexata]
MADEPKDSGFSLGGFFTRCGLPLSARDDCDAFARSQYTEPIRPAPFQGYCSYTVFVGEDTIIQFRPADYSLDIAIVSAACDVFGDLVPETKFLGRLDGTGLHIYSMRRLTGLSLTDLRSTNSSNCNQTKLQRQRMVKDFARLQAASWKNAKSKDQVREKGKVGSSLQWRLNLLSSGIPSRFQEFVDPLLRELPKIEEMPWIVSHGDFIPANVLVCPESGKLLGLLDWAEAEYLPFGISLYGLEELLGEVKNGCFEYFSEAKSLRKLFWSEILSMIPQLCTDADKLKIVRSAQIFGIFLWHGIAFDDGKLNRAVNEGTDDEEIQRLDAFLFDSSGPSSGYLRGQKPWLGVQFARLRDHLLGAI